MKKIIHLVHKFTTKVSERALSAYSAQTAFFLMLAFFPFLIFCFALLRNTSLTEEMFVRFLLAVIPESFRDFLSELIHDIYEKSSAQVVSITIVSALWLSSKAFLSLTQGINAMYSCKESRNYIIIRIFCIIYSVLFAIVIIAVLALLVYGNQINNFLLKHVSILTSISLPIINFRNIISLLLLLFTFSILYYFLPNCKIKMRFHIPGAVLSTLGWFSLSHLYSYYAENISNYSAFYGTMTNIALLMIWLYFCMYIFFLGGFINHYLITHHTKATYRDKKCSCTDNTSSHS